MKGNFFFNSEVLTYDNTLIVLWVFHMFSLSFFRELTSKEVAFFNRMHNVEPVVTESMDTMVRHLNSLDFLYLHCILQCRLASVQVHFSGPLIVARGAGPSNPIYLNNIFAVQNLEMA